MTSFLPSGFILINKPSGPTSHDVVDVLRRLTGIKKIGHAGTLDPFADGLLICAIGREATKNISQFADLPKTYEAVLVLGATSDTYDRTGQLKAQIFKDQPTKAVLQKTLKKFLGRQAQLPPMYSAKKIKGQKLYDLARAGQTIERQPCLIEIFALELLAYDWPQVRLRIKCSKGTYIRSLADDLGKALTTGAYVRDLKRTAIGQYQLDQAVEPEQLTAKNWPEYLFLPA